MSTVTRAISAIVFLAFIGCVTSPDWLSAERKMRPRTFAAVVRYRLATNPLSHHHELNIFMDGGVVPGLSARFNEYAVKVRSGSAGASRLARWYWLRVGRFTPNKVFILVEGSNAPLKLLELRRRNQQWIVVREEDPIVS